MAIEYMLLQYYITSIIGCANAKTDMDAVQMAMDEDSLVHSAVDHWCSNTRCEKVIFAALLMFGALLLRTDVTG